MVFQGKRYKIVKGKLQECKPTTLGQRYWNAWGHLEKIYPQKKDWMFYYKLDKQKVA